MRGGRCREGIIYRQQEHNQERGGWGEFSWEHVISQVVCVGVGGQAGQSEERQAFIDTTAKTFSNNCWPLLRHFFFRMGLRKSWRGAWSASFQCRLCWDNKRVSLHLTILMAGELSSTAGYCHISQTEISLELKLRSCVRLLFSGSLPYH